MSYFFSGTFLLAGVAQGGLLDIKIVAGVPREGGAFIIQAKASDAKFSKIKVIHGKYRGGEVEFFPLPDGSFGALLGVEYATCQGKPTIRDKLEISVEREEEKKAESQDFEFEVAATAFPSEKLSVPPRTIEPKKKDLVQIRADSKAVREAYAARSTVRLWDSNPGMPIDSQVTSVFGTSRVYNGKKNNPHLGTDLRAKMGTPVFAPIAGKVVLARKTFYLGNTIILDHGFGLFTIYGHLSKMAVVSGANVAKGKKLGLSGKTGRASGPHLHWAAHMNGVKVDPLLLKATLEQSARLFNDVPAPIKADAKGRKVASP